MFFPFLSSNKPKSLLFYSSIEYAVFFTFLALVSIFFIRFFLAAIKTEQTFKYTDCVYSQINIRILITGVGSPSPQYPQLHGTRALGTPRFRLPCSGVTRACAAQGGLKKLPPRISQKNFLTSSSYESMTIYLKQQSTVTEKRIRRLTLYNSERSELIRIKS